MDFDFFFFFLFCDFFYLFFRCLVFFWTFFWFHGLVFLLHFMFDTFSFFSFDCLPVLLFSWWTFFWFSFFLFLFLAGNRALPIGGKERCLWAGWKPWTKGQEHPLELVQVQSAWDGVPSGGWGWVWAIGLRGGSKQWPNKTPGHFTRWQWWCLQPKMVWISHLTMKGSLPASFGHQSQSKSWSKKN